MSNGEVLTMPNTREKLIELLEDTRANAAWHHWGYEESADYLIANGVTIQQWIPVTERLPENDQWVLCFMKDKSFGTFRVFQWNYIDWRWNDGNEWYDEHDVTHWMPLPEPPKGE